MRIQKSNIILDDNYNNILVKEFAKNYNKGVDIFDTPEKIVRVMNDVFSLNNFAEEYLYLMCMTKKCKPISFFEVSHGTHDASLVGAREIMIRALLCGAASIVIIHNHPSGDPYPSMNDIMVTKRIKAVSELIGITFIDHIIIGKEGFFSFKVNNMVFDSKE